MKSVLALIVLIALPSCVATSSDLRDLADEIRREVPDRGDLASAIDNKADEIEQRAEHLIEASTGVTSPGGLMEVALAAGLAFFGTNTYRNRTREAALRASRTA